jgi:GTP-binding protein EngB required for normal cell division
MNREQAITQYTQDKQGVNYVPKFQPKPLAIDASTVEIFEELKRHVIHVLNMASKGDKLAFNAVANESDQIKNRLQDMRNRLLADRR